MNIQTAIAGATSMSLGNFRFVEEIVMYSYANACTLKTQDLNGGVHDSQVLWMLLATPSALTTQTLSIVAQGAAPPTEGGANAFYTSHDAHCNSVVNDQASSGSIVITDVTSTEIAGTFDLTFAANPSLVSLCDAGGSDHVTGTFSAPICPALSASLLPSGSDDAGPNTCN